MAMQTFQDALHNDNENFEISIKSEGKEYVGHFANVRVDRDTLPDGWYAYDLRHGDENDGEICEVKNGYINVNHFGTFYTTEKLPLNEEESLKVDGKNVEYTFSPDIYNHEPWDGTMPIDFTGEIDGIEEFYIALHNSPMNVIGGIEGRVKHNALDKCNTVSLYIPRNSIPEGSENKSKLFPDIITVNTGMSEEQLEVFKLPVFEINQEETEGMFLFEYQDYIMQKSKNQVYKYAPEAFKEMFPEEYMERTIKKQELEINNNRLDYLKELAQKPKLSTAALMGVSKAYFYISFSSEDVSGSTEKILDSLDKAGFSEARKNLILDGIAECIDNEVTKKEYQDILSELRKSFKTYIKGLKEGKGSEPLTVRHEILKCYESIKKDETPTTIQTDVKDIMARYGFTIKEKGIGWAISAPKKVKQNTR